MSLLEHRRNVHSQNGEDGVLECILEKLGIPKDGTCCEFGAWDGKHLSNTFRLVDECNYRALYIEGDQEKFKDLLETRDKYPTQIVPVHSMVTGENLDSTLKEHGFYENLDVLSIDIDSTDYEVWKNSSCRPKIVIIEVDNSIPSWIKKPIYPVTKEGGANSFIVKQLAIEKGYTFLCTTGNLFFVRDDLRHLVQPDTDVEFPWWLPSEIKQFVFAILSCSDDIKALCEELPKYARGMKLGYLSV